MTPRLAPSSRAARTAAPLLLAALVLTACAPGSSDTSSGGSSTTTSSSATPTASDSASGIASDEGTATSSSPSASQSPSDGASEASSSPSASVGVLGAPVGSRTLKRGTEQYTLKVYQPQRQDQLVTLTVDLVADKVTGSSPDASVLADPTSALSVAGRVPNGFALVDTAGQKMYLPATTGDGVNTAACSPSYPNTMTSGDVYTFSCLFAGVPQDLARVTVRSATFGNFPNVGLR